MPNPCWKDIRYAIAVDSSVSSICLKALNAHFADSTIAVGCVHRKALGLIILLVVGESRRSNFYCDELEFEFEMKSVSNRGHG